MKVLHVTYSFAPDPPGGTEIYVDGLCRALAADGIQSVVAAPGAADAAYDVDGLRVRRFATAGHGASLDVLYGAGDTVASAAFAAILDEEQPDVVHQHALSPACSIDFVRRAHATGRPVVFTYHTPAVSCQRGSLLHLGRDVCSGHLEESRCTACVLDDLGLNPFVRRIAGAVPAGVGRVVGRQGFAGGVWTATRMTSLMETRLREARALFATVDAFVALSPWVAALLDVNGVPPSRVIASAHGIDYAGRPAARSRGGDLPLRLVHLGRVDPNKGTALLLRALAADPALAVELDVYGVLQNGADGAVLDAIRAVAARDGRIHLRSALPHDRVIEALASYDAVVVPSQWMETGPLVVLEACAAGVPVLGSDLGGIADKVTHDRDGLLVDPYDDEGAWTAALRRCTADPSLLRRLREAVSAPRTMADVAADMRVAYDRVTRARRPMAASS